MKADPDDNRPDRKTHAASAPSPRAVVAALAGIAATWLGAASVGLMSPPLRHGLTWVALAVALVASWPARQEGKERWILIAALVIAAGLIAQATPVYGVLAVSLVLAMLARANEGLDRRTLLATAFAALVLGVFILACASIPTVWSIADALAGTIAGLAAIASGKPLWVGPTFAGLDFLVLMAALYGVWLVWTPRPRLARALYAGAAILGGHLAYLVLLSYSVDLHEALPQALPPPEFRDYIPPPWSWSNAVRSLLPWNMPLLAGVIHLAIAAAMLRWSTWRKDEGGRMKDEKRETGHLGSSFILHPSSFPRKAHLPGCIVLAILVPLLTTLAPGQSDLADKKIVAYDRGLLDWDKPVHDRYGQASAGMYGMLPEFVRSLGGRFERSAELTEKYLGEADVLLVIHPAQPWAPEQLERIWDFVRRGGSLLVAAGTMVREGDLASSFNELLEPTGIEVRFDTAAPVTWHWQHSYTAMAHPATTGIDDRPNRFGLDEGPSIRVRWPARPVLLGRWGWSDPGTDSVLTRAYRHDAGEQLGDLVLAAEATLGRGTVFVLSDTFALGNEGNVDSYVFTGRLLASLAGRAGNPQAAWRQALGLLGCIALVTLVVWPPRRKDEGGRMKDKEGETGHLDSSFIVQPSSFFSSTTRIAAVALVLALTLAASRTFSHVSMRVMPDGRGRAAFNDVAYIDASHVEAYSDSGWGYDGIAGFALTLMRNGYQPFLLPEVTSERLDRAGMLISIAPARPFSAAERAAVRRFVEGGGVFIAMAGAEQAGPIQPLLEEFDLRVPRSPVGPGEEDREPKPMGYEPIRYLSDPKTDSYGLVHLYTAWPIECSGLSVLLRGTDGLPVASWQQVGSGKVVLIGDPWFAMNRNLEYMGGEPFLG
ncbi:MAG: DUF4350 domain-containing protein, partial [Planctomycetota bacterium]